jgi:hypothetical protein
VAFPEIQTALVMEAPGEERQTKAKQGNEMK